MSINATSHVSIREFAIRTGNDGHTQAGRIHTPDPAAVANLNRILGQQAQARPRPQSPQDAFIAAILKKAKEKKQNSPEKPEEKELPKMNKWDASELITAEVVAGWAERIRAGESRNQVAKNNELGVSDYTIRRNLEKHGYHRTTGEPTESDAEPKTAAPKAAEKPSPAKPAPSTAAAAPPAKTAVALTSSPNSRAVANAAPVADVPTSDTATGDAPAIAEQLANLRQLLAAIPRGKDIKIHGKISIELEF